MAHIRNIEPGGLSNEPNPGEGLQPRAELLFHIAESGQRPSAGLHMGVKLETDDCWPERARRALQKKSTGVRQKLVTSHSVVRNQPKDDFHFVVVSQVKPR